MKVFVNKFDGRLLTWCAKKAQNRVLKHQGAILRRSGRQLIRKRKTPSKPGSPPRSVRGTLKDSIQYAYDARQNEVVVGPVRLTGSRAQRTLEFGGRVELPEIFIERKFGAGLPPSAGGNGPVQILSSANAWTEPFGFGEKDPEFKGANKGWSRKVHVIWRRLRTEREAENANRQYAVLMALLKIHPTTKTTGEVLPRPYMSAALRKCQAKLVELWRDSLK